MGISFGAERLAEAAAVFCCVFGFEIEISAERAVLCVAVFLAAVFGAVVL